MDDFLTPVSTTKVKRTEVTKPLVQERQPSKTSATLAVSSPGAALEALKEQPDFDTVSRVLEYLATQAGKENGFSLIIPDAVAANIAYQLVNTTIPDYWQTLKESKSQSKHLVTCLRNPCGIGAIVTRLRLLIVDCRQKKPDGIARDSSSYIEDLLSVLKQVLSGDDCSRHVWSDVQSHSKTAVQAKMMWKEYVTQVASGRMLSLAAEAEDVVKERKSSMSTLWLASGNEYASWLGRNIAALMRTAAMSEDTTMITVDLCGKALSLGYTDRVVGSMLLSLLETESIKNLTTLIQKMKVFEQRKYLNAIVTFAVKQYFGSVIEGREDASLQPLPMISGVASFIRGLLKDDETLKEHFVSSLTKSSISSLDDSLAARRSVIAALAQDEDQLHSLLENGLKLFGDSFYIKHTPILQQEALAQTLAITCGYVQRSQPLFLTMMAKSSYHVSGMSNRIGAPSPRARFLGIAVGMAISKMVDKPDVQLKFDLDGHEVTEAAWYQRLTEVNDKLGNIADLKTEDRKVAAKQATSKPKPSKPAKRASKPSKASLITEVQGPRIVEILSESEDEDDDLIPYEKPDSDPEDDTDDPTEINRNKPTAPVYIRDLITGLRDQENYDRHALSLSTAAPLIRRKANFGTEVTDHIEELATILTGLNDNLELENFAQHRQQALIAILLAKPADMAQWFARTFFSGDYSLSQRTAILTTLGLGARELAGLKDSSTDDLLPPTPSFPSKQLPSHLHALYATPSAPLANLTSGMAKQILSPLAAQAADQLTGPNILKVRTFSSRMEVEKRRSKPIPNALAQIVADNFFFPLTGRWWIATRSSSSSSEARGSIYTSTHLLPTFLQTLALLLNASGPNTLSLPQMTREFWELLLSVRGLALNDKRILNALLFALLMLLETNENRERLATEQSKELLETQEWVRMVFEGLPAGKGGEGEEDERVRVLAAGVVVRCQEVVEKYQRRLVGSMMDY